MGTSTIWGTADCSMKIARGIVSYSTPSHGGFHLSPTRQAEMPEVLKIESGWYEEDCDWCLVVMAFPQFFENADLAKSCMRKWHPDRYEKFFGVELIPKESYMRQNVRPNATGVDIGGGVLNLGLGGKHEHKESGL